MKFRYPTTHFNCSDDGRGFPSVHVMISILAQPGVFTLRRLRSFLDTDFFGRVVVPPFGVVFVRRAVASPAEVAGGRRGASSADTTRISSSSCACWLEFTAFSASASPTACWRVVRWRAPTRAARRTSAAPRTARVPSSALRADGRFPAAAASTALHTGAGSGRVPPRARARAPPVRPLQHRSGPAGPAASPRARHSAPDQGVLCTQVGQEVNSHLRYSTTGSRSCS